MKLARSYEVSCRIAVAHLIVIAFQACGPGSTDPLPTKCQTGVIESIAEPSELTLEECEAAGGWIIGGPTRRLCTCPTNDAGKECSSSNECEGGCFLQTRDRDVCSTATAGACDVMTARIDCICTIGSATTAGGGNLVLCID